MRYHLIGFIFHVYYVVLNLVYINQVYIENDRTQQRLWRALFCVAISFPTLQKLNELFARGPWAFFSDSLNWLSIFYIGGSIANVVLLQT